MFLAPAHFPHLMSLALQGVLGVAESRAPVALQDFSVLLLVLLSPALVYILGLSRVSFLLLYIISMSYVVAILCLVLMRETRPPSWQCLLFLVIYIIESTQF